MSRYDSHSYSHGTASGRSRCSTHSTGSYSSSHGHGGYSSSHGNGGYSSSHGHGSYASSHGSGSLSSSHGHSSYSSSHGHGSYSSSHGNDGHTFTNRVTTTNITDPSGRKIQVRDEITQYKSGKQPATVTFRDRSLGPIREDAYYSDSSDSSVATIRGPRITELSDDDVGSSRSRHGGSRQSISRHHPSSQATHSQRPRARTNAGLIEYRPTSTRPSESHHSSSRTSHRPSESYHTSSRASHRPSESRTESRGKETAVYREQSRGGDRTSDKGKSRSKRSDSTAMRGIKALVKHI